MILEERREKLKMTNEENKNDQEKMKYNEMNMNDMSTNIVHSFIYTDSFDDQWKYSYRLECSTIWDCQSYLKKRQEAKQSSLIYRTRKSTITSDKLLDFVVRCACVSLVFSSCSLIITLCPTWFNCSKTKEKSRRERERDVTIDILTHDYRY
jgi:hypothetical protein